MARQERINTLKITASGINSSDNFEEKDDLVDTSQDTSNENSFSEPKKPVNKRFKRSSQTGDVIQSASSYPMLSHSENEGPQKSSLHNRPVLIALPTFEVRRFEA